MDRQVEATDLWQAVKNRLTTLGGVRVKLSVVGGLHDGVERELDPGSYTFGHSPNCHFALEDPELETLAFELRVGARAVEVVAHQPLGLHDGTELLLVQSGYRTAMPLPGEIHIGDLVLHIGPDGAGSNTVAWATRNPLITGLAALAILVAGVYLVAQADDRQMVVEANNSQDEIEKVVREAGFDRTLAVKKVNGAWHIEGQLDGRNDIETLNAALDAAGLSPSIDITDRSAILRNVQTILAAFPGRLEAKWIEDRRVHVAGHIPTEHDRSNLSLALQNDVRGVEAVELDVRTFNDIARLLREELDAREIDTQLDLTVVDQTLLVKGRIASIDMEKWRDAKIWYDRSFDGVLPLRTELTESVPSGPNIEIKAIWSGNDPYVISGNGGKYSLGAILPGGWQIEDILTDRLVLNRNGALVELRM